MLNYFMSSISIDAQKFTVYYNINSLKLDTNATYLILRNIRLHKDYIPPQPFK